MRTLLFQTVELFVRGLHGMSTAAAIDLFSKKTPPSRRRILLRGVGVRVYQSA